MRYFVTFAIALALCFALQGFALRASGGRFTKSESNFFSSIGRIQAGAMGRPEIMVLGSSITGRLPDRAQGFTGVANMGCDGGSAVDSLRAMDQGILPIAQWIIIEANTLHLALKSEPTEISKAMRGQWFRAGKKFPCLSSYARPSAFFYSKLLAKKTGDTGTVDRTANLCIASKPAPSSLGVAAQLTAEQEALAEEINGILHRLEAKGSRFLFAWLPPARSDGTPPPQWILETARRSRALWWDAGQEAAPGTVTLTDGVHMAAPSAARTTVSILKALDRR